MPAVSIESEPQARQARDIVGARCRIALVVIAALVAAALLAHLAVLLWAQNELTPVESIVALHANMLAMGQGLYEDLNHNPQSVSAYGPIFYAATALLHRLGLPIFQSARLLSFGALLGALWCVWRVLNILIADPYARAAGLIVAASTENLSFWGTVGQADMLGACLSLAAFTSFLTWRDRRSTLRLVASGVCVLLAVFTKPTFIAAGVAIGFCLLWQHAPTGIRWILGVASAGATAALAFNALTHGTYYQNVFIANLNPFSLAKLGQHLRYFGLTCSGVLVVIAAGLRHSSRRIAPLYIYSILAAGVWIATAAKVGSDVNYQIETMLLIAVCAAAALDRLEFFPKLFRQDRELVTLLNIPLLLHVVLNVMLTMNVLAARVLLEPRKAAETAALLPYLQQGGRVLTSRFNVMMHAPQHEKKPLMYDLLYAMLVNSGRIDQQPILQDLAGSHFRTIVLSQDIFARRPASWDNHEVVSLAPALVEELRKNYELIAHVNGPDFEGDYVYQPRNQ